MAGEKNYKKATFAGGCFWCMEKPFDKADGVVSTVSGYIGGDKINPTYEEVSAGASGHAEALQVEYDAKKVSYKKLLEIFWQNIDPLDAGGQFCDRGSQYRSEIFVHDDEQMKLAQKSKSELDAGGKLTEKIVTKITEASKFYPAEDYHQNYYKTNPVRYNYYRFACGRDKRLKQLWGGEFKY